MMNPNPETNMFSVMVISYNHEKFIDQAIQSILSQQFSHRIEIVIGVDKSSDQTLALCKKLQEQHPDTIVLIEHQQNVGMHRNFVNTLKRCTGKYIALLEGDDFWTNSQKLQTQYDYFEANPHCILSGGMTDTVNETGTVIRKATDAKGAGRKYSRAEQILANRFQTLTVAIRKDRINWQALEMLKSSPHLDWPFFVSLDYRAGDYAYRFHSVFGAYREHGSGVYSMVAAEKKLINTGKTVYWLSQLEDLTAEQRDYLVYLFANLLKDRASQLEPPFSEFFNASYIVYHKGLIRFRFLSKISYLAWQYLLKGKAFAFQYGSKLELIRQTKVSKGNYVQLLMNPLVDLTVLKRAVSTIQ